MPYRICRRQNVNQASYDRAGACATTTSAEGNEPRSPGQRQAPALYLPFAHACLCVNCGTCAYAASPTERATGTGHICKPYQGTPSVLEFEFGFLQIREIWLHGRIQAHYKLIEIPESDVSWRNFGLSKQSKCKIANFNLHARIPKGGATSEKTISNRCDSAPLTNAFERGGHVTHRDSQQARD